MMFLVEPKSSVLYICQGLDNRCLFAGSAWYGQFPGAEVSWCRQSLASFFYLDATNSAARATHILYRTTTLCLALWERCSKDGPVLHASLCISFLFS